MLYHAHDELRVEASTPTATAPPPGRIPHAEVLNPLGAHHRHADASLMRRYRFSGSTTTSSGLPSRREIEVDRCAPHISVVFDSRPPPLRAYPTGPLERVHILPHGAAHLELASFRSDDPEYSTLNSARRESIHIPKKPSSFCLTPGRPGSRSLLCRSSFPCNSSNRSEQVEELVIADRGSLAYG